MWCARGMRWCGIWKGCTERATSLEVLQECIAREYRTYVLQGCMYSTCVDGWEEGSSEGCKSSFESDEEVKDEEGKESCERG